ncbi:MAG: DUF2911 domain-containing protein [Acidobacteriota bacterium]
MLLPELSLPSPSARLKTLAASTLLAAAATGTLQAQSPGLTLPPSGGNQKGSILQQIGPVEVRIDYSSPDVTGPGGQDRRGQIWGQLVPYGLTNLGFGNGNPGPWRAGANENTVFTVSHDVEVEGKPLAAGTYGLHMIADEKEWTIIFSKNASSWGSFFYDPAEDALRVTVRPEKAEYREWLTYDALDRQPTSAKLALHWEELRVPFEVSVPEANDIYLTQIREDLRGSAGFTWQNWNAAAQFCLTTGHELEQGLAFAESAISAPFVGQENFTTLQTKAALLNALSRPAEAKVALDKAARHPTAGPQQVHTLARTLQGQGMTALAVELFLLNAERFGEGWPMNVGLARAHSAQGDFKKALKYARAAHEDAPDPLNKGNLEKVIEILESGRDFNATN